ncbi:hypothetical protein, partial [Acidaminococcus intestini]
FRFGDLIVRVDAVYVHFFMQKWGEERIFPHPNIYYRTLFDVLGKGSRVLIGLFPMDFSVFSFSYRQGIRQ